MTAATRWQYVSCGAVFYEEKVSPHNVVNEENFFEAVDYTRISHDRENVLKAGIPACRSKRVNSCGNSASADVGGEFFFLFYLSFSFLLL